MSAGAAQRELGRLVAALGHAVEGGALYDAAVLLPLPEGAPPATPPYLLARVDALPLPAAAAAALRSAGYAPLAADPGTQRGPAGALLEITAFEDDDDVWLERLAVRDLLAAAPGGATGALEPAAYRDPERIAAASVRRRAAVGFAPLRDLAVLLSGLDVRWSIASGWSLELHLGAPARLHDDLDVAVPYGEQLPVLERLRARGWRLDVPVGPGNGVGGGVYTPWDGVPVESPLAQVHARPAADPFGGRIIDVLLTPADTDAWRFRRRPEVRRAWSRARRVRDVDGVAVPYLAPEIACLYKVGGAGRRHRAKDARDLERALPALSVDGRAWLADALRLCYPDSPWRARL